VGRGQISLRMAPFQPVPDRRQRFPVSRTQAERQERVVQAIEQWLIAHGKPPRPADWHRAGSADHGTWPASTVVYRAFGSWSSALEAAGLGPTAAPASREELRAWVIASVQRWVELYGSPPRRQDWRTRQPGWPTSHDVRRAFGTMSAAVAAAGLRPRRRGEIAYPTQFAKTSSPRSEGGRRNTVDRRARSTGIRTGPRQPCSQSSRSASTPRVGRALIASRESSAHGLPRSMPPSQGPAATDPPPGSKRSLRGVFRIATAIRCSRGGEYRCDWSMGGRWNGAGSRRRPETANLRVTHRRARARGLSATEALHNVCVSKDPAR
jgi:hypothetical protein